MKAQIPSFPFAPLDSPSASEKASQPASSGKSSASVSSLAGKKLIVLGGSSGLGLATAKAAATEGAHIVIVSGNQARVDLALKELPEGSEGYVVNLSQEANIRDFFAKAGPLDHLVYTAGENLSLKNIADTDLEEARKFFTLRYWSALAAVKYAAPHINPGGSIGLTGGIASPRPGKGWSLASSICGAMEGFTRAMAVELAPLRVNLVSPGVVRTNLWDSMPAEDRESFYKSISDTLLLKRVGEAENIAQAFLYLMKQPFGTGNILVVDGGAVLV